MKWIIVVLAIVCMVESYFMYTAKKERDFFYGITVDMNKGAANTAYYLALIHLKLAEDVQINPANAQEIANSLVCQNPSVKNYVNVRSITDETRNNLKNAVVKMDAYCNSRNIKMIEPQ